MYGRNAKETDRVEKILQMKTIEILAEHSTLSPGPGVPDS
jgi:hypothetical protein